MNIEDARRVEEFAKRVQPLLRGHAYTLMLEEARRVGRIAYCCIADARQKARHYEKEQTH